MITITSGSSRALHHLERNMAGSPIRCPVALELAVRDDRLFFSGEIGESPDFDETLTSGSFIEGLWRRDCIELFLAGGDSYFELNLSPGGAVWACLFSAPRQRIGTASDLILKASGEVGNDRWQASAELSLQHLMERLGSVDTWTGNFTAILGGCPDSEPNPANLHSWAQLKSKEPDFHRPCDFDRVQFV